MALVTAPEEVVEGEDWVIDHLFPGERSDDEIPGVDDTRRLLREYHDEWCMHDVTPQMVVPSVFRVLRIDPDGPAATWNEFMIRFTRDYIRWRRLDRWTRVHHIDTDGEVRGQLTTIAQIYNMVRTLIIHNNSLCRRMRTGTDGGGAGPAILPEGEGDRGGTTLANADEAKLRAWQDSFLQLRVVLAGENFRRAGNYFLGRSVTATSNLETQAFQPAMEIVDFINENTRYDNNFELWRVHTSTAGLHEEMIRYMTERPLAEAPDIEENCHLRSYEGDECGRGAVIYDSVADMAWPYAARSEWKRIETRVNEIRERVFHDRGENSGCKRHLVKRPDPEDVCVVHLKSAFEDDTFTEAQELVADNTSCFLQCAWYESAHFECSHDRYRLKNLYRVEAYMQRMFPRDAPDEPDVWGRSWQKATPTFKAVGSLWKRSEGGTRPETGTEIHCDALAGALLDQRTEFDLAEVDAFGVEFLADSYIAVATQSGAVEYYRQHAEYTKIRPKSSEALGCITDLTTYPLSEKFLKDHVSDEPIARTHFVCDANGDPWVPLLWRARKCRHRLTMDTWVALGGTRKRVDRRSFVVLKPYAGQRWAQVAIPPDGYDVLSVSSEVCDLLSDNLFEGESCLPEDVANTLTIAETAYVRAYDVVLIPVPPDDDATRYLRVHTGRNWRDCSTPQFDKIYDSQKFCPYDKFMLWAQKGRTLYIVHEFDTYQLTFIIVGYGGTGKSTIMTVMQKLWPAHLRGVLSSNIEQKFGMSQVLQKGRVRAIFCNEVSEDLQLVQEEWQTSCSGEEGSYAVKHESPWTGVCKACHFWVGNGFPRHWKNNNNQVSRRLCGVLMDTPIQPRDGNVLEEIDKILGTVQRKMVLAYFDMLEQYGTIDPMSRPERLPPAFESFYSWGRGLSNPVEMFLDEMRGVKFEINLGMHPVLNRPYVMLTSTFRNLYIEWRGTRNDLPRVPNIPSDKYLPPLRELGVVEHSRVRVKLGNGTIDTAPVLYGIGSCDAAEIPEIL